MPWCAGRAGWPAQTPGPSPSSGRLAQAPPELLLCVSPPERPAPRFLPSRRPTPSHSLIQLGSLRHPSQQRSDLTPAQSSASPPFQLALSEAPPLREASGHRPRLCQGLKEKGDTEAPVLRSLSRQPPGPSALPPPGGDTPNPLAPSRFSPPSSLLQLYRGGEALARRSPPTCDSNPNPPSPTLGATSQPPLGAPVPLPLSVHPGGQAWEALARLSSRPPWGGHTQGTGPGLSGPVRLLHPAGTISGRQWEGRCPRC